jgi:hypothetical protein
VAHILVAACDVSSIQHTVSYDNCFKAHSSKMLHPAGLARYLINLRTLNWSSPNSL